MNEKWLVVFFVAFSLLLTLAQPVHADGIIIPEPPPCLDMGCPPPPRPMAQLEIRYHRVRVVIEDQIAVTHVDQVFFNPNEWAVEGMYVFPLPRDAAVSAFTLWIDGEPVQGEVLDAEQARRTYEEIVNQLRDPALLEYAGQGAVRASVFPIPPQGERRIELEYTQALTAEGGLVRYVYPLNTEKFSLQPLEQVSVQVEIRDRQSIRAVYSPSHPIAVDRQSENRASAGYEDAGVLPDTDFALFYSLGEREAFHLLSYRNPGDPLDGDGFFLLLLAPSPEVNPEPVAKDVLLVLDRSGSMDGEKFVQAQEALRYILRHLNPQDRFHLLSFSTGIERFSDNLRPAEDANEALAWVDRLSAAGSTDINRALLESAAVMDPERPTYLIFLTDGLPTEGVVETPEILANFSSAARSNLRLFSFGVGYDVDTFLLDSLSQEHHGLSTYVRPGEAIDEVLSAFYEGISTPVLTDLRIDFGDLRAYDIYPEPLPDLFAGSQVVVVGRYRQGGTSDVVLTGFVNGQERTLRFAQQSFVQDSRADLGAAASLPRLWATRKIGYLLNQVRLNGPDREMIDQIVSLSIRYGIVTPYTSYLVTEDAPFGAQTRQDISDQAFQSAEKSEPQVSGQGAVDRAAQEGALQSADSAPSSSRMNAGSTADGSSGVPSVRVVGARTFIKRDGVWIDTAYDPAAGDVREIEFLSKGYFDLLDARPDLAPVLALGSHVVVMVDGTPYRVTDGAVQGPVILPEALPTPLAQVEGTPDAPLPSGLSTEPRPQETAAQPASSAARTGVCGGAFIAPLAVVGWMLVLKKRSR